MSADIAPLKLDLASHAFKANPYATYTHLRWEAPVALAQLPDGRQAWLISRYADVMAALKDPRLVKDRRKVTTQHRMRFERFLEPLFQSLQFNMLDLDPPDHTRLRSLVHKAFTPRLVEQLRERITELCEHFLAPAATKGRIELVRQYALPLPMAIIAEVLGIPKHDRQRFHSCSSR